MDASQSMVPGPVALTSPENLLEMPILRSYPRSSESETLRVEPGNLCVNKVFRWLGSTVSLRTRALVESLLTHRLRCLFLKFPVPYTLHETRNLTLRLQVYMQEITERERVIIALKDPRNELNWGRRKNGLKNTQLEGKSRKSLW